MIHMRQAENPYLGFLFRCYSDPENGTSKAALRRTFKIPRTTLIDTLQRAGWSAHSATKLPKLAKKT